MAAPGVGVREIREQHGDSGKPKCSRYAVKETKEHAPGVTNVRRFRLTKPGGAEWYFVYLPNDTERDWDICDCVGYTKYHTCKHTRAMRALLDAGELDEKADGYLPSCEK